MLLVYSLLYITKRGLHLYIYIIKCKQVPTLKFSAQMIILTMIPDCNLYK